MNTLSRLALAFSLLSGATLLQAQTLYHTDFTGANGATPADWLYVTDPYAQMSIQNNTFKITRPESGGLRSTAVFDGQDSSGNSARSWTDYTVSTRFQGTNFTVATSAIYGVIARFDDETETQQLGYTAYLLGNEIKIAVNASTLQGNAGNEISSAALSQSLSNDTWYWLQFTLEGDSLTAVAYLDNNGAIGAEIGSTTVSDATFTSGTAGVRAGFSSTGERSISYDNFTVSAIPEPGFYAAMLGLVSVLGVILVRRKS